MIVNRLETFSNRWVGFVKVTTDTGDEGWGQMSTYNADITAGSSTARWRPMPSGTAPVTLPRSST